MNKNQKMFSHIVTFCTNEICENAACISFSCNARIKCNFTVMHIAFFTWHEKEQSLAALLFDVISQLLCLLQCLCNLVRT